jgi:hypothetical protein
LLSFCCSTGPALARHQLIRYRSRFVYMFQKTTSCGCDSGKEKRCGIGSSPLDYLHTVKWKFQNLLRYDPASSIAKKKSCPDFSKLHLMKEYFYLLSVCYVQNLKSYTKISWRTVFVSTSALISLKNCAWTYCCSIGVGIVEFFFIMRKPALKWSVTTTLPIYYFFNLFCASGVVSPWGLYFIWGGRRDSNPS